MNNKVIIITDSVSMPRPGVEYESTWICMLKKKFPALDIMDRSARGSTSRRLVTEGGGGADLLESYMPGLVIVQLGLAECAPRLFKKSGLEFFIMNKLFSPGLRNRYINFIKKRRDRKPELSETSPEEFRNNLNNYMLRCSNNNVKLIIVKILRPTELYISKSPHIKECIDRANNIIDDLAKNYTSVYVVNPVKDSIDVNKICLDELHIDTAGNKLYFDTISACVRKLYRFS